LKTLKLDLRVVEKLVKTRKQEPARHLASRLLFSFYLLRGNYLQREVRN
jgi:hypothetical protein